MQQMISNVRTMFLFRGIAAILFGILTLVWPNLTLSVLVLLFGVFAVVSGITAAAGALMNQAKEGRGLLMLDGIPGKLPGGVDLGLATTYIPHAIFFPVALRASSR